MSAGQAAPGPLPLHPLDLAAMAAYGVFFGYDGPGTVAAWATADAGERENWRAAVDAALSIGSGMIDSGPRPG